MSKQKINKQHKDRVFKFIFGRNKAWALSLYNAINGSNYTDPEAIEFNTIEEILYIGMHNDISFILYCFMQMLEQQSSFNPNMPIRFLLHSAQLYDKYMFEHNCYRYGKKLIKLPCPKCVCFYNGTEEQPEEIILSLSDAFITGESDIEVKVRMLNINYGKNTTLMKACKPLYEYSWLIEAIRQGDNDIEKAVDEALDKLPNDFEIKKFLLMHRAEVKGMFLTEYDEEKILAQERQEGIQEANERVVANMLKKALPLQLIKEITQLSDDVIRGIALNLGLAVR